MCILLITISWVIFRTVYRYLARHIYLCDNLYLYGWIGGEFFAEMHKDWILLPTAGSSKQNISFLYIFPISSRLFFFISSLVLAKSAYLKVARAHMPGYCFCFSNLHRFTVFAFVKSLNCFAICSVLTEAFSLCILLKEGKAREGIFFILIFFELLTKVSMKDYN